MYDNDCQLSIRKNGQWFHQQISQQELRFLCWKPRLFESPQDWARLAFRGVKPGGLFPHDAGIVIIDEDTRWVGICNQTADPFYLPTTGLSTGPSMTWAVFEAATEDGLTLMSSDYDPAEDDEPSYKAMPMERPTTLSLADLHAAIGKAIEHTPAPAEGMPKPQRFLCRNPAPGWTVERFYPGLLTGWERLLEAMKERRQVDRDALPKWEAYMMELFGDGAVTELTERISREALAGRLEGGLPDGVKPRAPRPRV